jgi:hypothetical protein
MIIYVDENMSPYLARGFDILQRPESTKLRDPIEVRSIKDEFGEGALGRGLDSAWPVSKTPASSHRIITYSVLPISGNFASNTAWGCFIFGRHPGTVFDIGIC